MIISRVRVREGVPRFKEQSYDNWLLCQRFQHCQNQKCDHACVHVEQPLNSNQKSERLFLCSAILVFISLADLSVVNKVTT